MQNLSPLAPQFSLGKKRRLNPHFANDESPFAVIQKSIFTQQILPENTNETGEFSSRAYATMDLSGRANATTGATTGLSSRAYATTGLSPVFSFIENNDLENLEILIAEYPEVLEQKFEDELTPVFFAIENNNLEALRIITNTYSDALNQTNQNGLTPIFFTIINNELEALKIIIETYPEDLSQAYDHRLTPIFFAIENNKFEAVKVIIEACPEILEQKLEDDLTPIFFAIEYNNLPVLKIIIESDPKTLEQIYEGNLTPIFWTIYEANIEAIKTIIETYPNILEQEDENKNVPIIKIVELYDYNPSKKNKNLLQDIFELQFKRKLNDDAIENLVNFVRNFQLLKLIYEDSGQVLKENSLKKILGSVIIFDHDEEDNLTTKLISIYQKICQEEIDEIIFFNKNGEKNSLHIFNSDMKDHSSYFIFHVNEKNKLTAISYCDGNEVYDERAIESTHYIYGATTYILKAQEDFSRDEKKKYIKKNFQEKDFDNLCEKICKIDCLETIYSIPTKAQIKENCTFKSINILARFLLEYQRQEKIFDFDFENSRPSGIGHEAYKKLKEKLVQNASENLILSAEKLGEDFCNQVKLCENIKIFLERSSKKITPATRFSQSSIEKISNFLTPNNTNLVC